MSSPSSNAISPSQAVRIGILAMRGTKQCLTQWAATADFLTRKVPGFSFVVVPLDFNTIYPAVRQREVDFVLANSSFFISLEKNYCASPVVTLKNLRLNREIAVFAGTIFTRSNHSTIRNLADLRGKRFVAVETKSFGGWQMAWREMKREGIDPFRDLADLSFAGTHDAVVDAILKGAADAGTVRTDTIESMANEGKIQQNKLRLVSGRRSDAMPFWHSTRLYPEWPLAAFPHTDSALAQKVAIALMTMQRSDQAARNADIAGWTSPANYQEVHACLRELRIEPYQDYGKVTLWQAARQHWLPLTAILLLAGAAATSAAIAAYLNRRLRLTQFTLDNTTDAVYWIGPDARILYVNDAACRALGYRRRTLQSLTVADFSPDYPLAAWPGHWQRLKEEHSFVLETVHKRKDGTTFPVEIAANLIQFGQKEYDCVFARDITERKQAEETLRKTIQQLSTTRSQLLQSEKMAAIGQLTSGLAHEINNPVGFIYSNLGVLKHYWDDIMTVLASYEEHEPQLPQESYAKLKELKEQIDLAYLREDFDNLITESIDGLRRVKGIVQDMRNFSHSGEAEIQWVNLESNLDSTFNISANELKEKAEIIKEYGGIPEIECIPSQLNQVFMNLILNAAQAIPEQGKITVRTGQSKDKVWIEITDTGSGIQPEHRSHLFEPFFTTKPVGQGTGLGLSVSYGIVHKHGGTIDVDTEIGKGTTFRITLPIQAAASLKETKP